MNAPSLDPAKTWAARTLPHERQVTRCRFSPCGRFLFAGGLDQQVFRWELDGDRKTALEGHTSWIGALAVHPTAGLLYSGDYHGALLAWKYEAETREPAWRVPQAHPGWVRALAVSPDGKRLASGGCDGTVRLWSALAGKPLQVLSGHPGPVFSLLFHPDGSLASADLMGKVIHWDLGAGKAVRTLDAGRLHTRKEEFLADVGGVRGMAIDGAGARLACCGLTDAESNTFCPGTPAVLLFDWKTGELKQQLRVSGKVDGYVNAVRFLADGTLAGHGEGTGGAALWFWKAGEAEPFHSLPGPTAYDLDLHPDGTRLAAALFEPKGRTGNGRHAKTREEYVPNGGSIRLFCLYPKPGGAANGK